MNVLKSLAAALAVATVAAPALAAESKSPAAPAAPAVAAASAAAATSARPAEKVYCVVDAPSGTLIRRTYCKTAKQWLAADMEFPAR